MIFWKFYGEDEEIDDNVGNDHCEDSHRCCFARAYHVFNAEQVDGFTIPDLPHLPDTERIQSAENFFRKTGIQIIEKGGRACYDSQADEVHMPPFALFKKADYFYSTLAHETIHNAESRIMPRSSLPQSRA